MQILPTIFVDDLKRTLFCNKVLELNILKTIKTRSKNK